MALTGAEEPGCGALKGRGGLVGALVLAAVGASWREELRSGERSYEARSVYEDLPRTAPVLDVEDAEYLASFYRERNTSWPASYFNMLLHRWSAQDERMGRIFEKVIEAANRLPGGSGDYTITNDFFSYRAQGAIQFAPMGAFHMDCDFWKVNSSDGFNLWVLIAHNELDSSFDIVERKRNVELYKWYDGSTSLYLLPESANEPDSPYMITGGPVLPFRRSPDDLLNWRPCAVLLKRLLTRFIVTRGGTRRPPSMFTQAAPTLSHVKLAIGEALVLREQELHRSDLHLPLRPGQFRLAAGFKLQQRNAVISQYDPECTSQKDRFNIPGLWERNADLVQPVYTQKPRKPLQHMGFRDRVLLLLVANSHCLACLVLLAGAAPMLGFSRRVRLALVLALVALPAFVALVHCDWLLHGATTSPGEGARRRGAIRTIFR